VIVFNETSSHCHLQQLRSAMPTVRFQILYVFLVLAHDRRRILHVPVAAHQRAESLPNRIRRECLNNVIVCHEQNLPRHLHAFFRKVSVGQSCRSQSLNER
jgi:hypothetical protein